MQSGIRTTVIACLAFIVIVVGMFVRNVSMDRGLNDEALRDVGIVLLPRPREISPFEFKDTAGRPFTNANFVGHWTLVYFGYTYCPDACPTTLRDLAKAMPAVQQAMAKKHQDTPVQVVFVSVDPERDTLPHLAEYLRFFSPAFIGATADRERLAALATQLNVTFGKVPGATPNTYAIDHTTNVVLLNPKGHYHAFIRPPFTAARLSVGLPGTIARF